MLVQEPRLNHKSGFRKHDGMKARANTTQSALLQEQILDMFVHCGSRNLSSYCADNVVGYQTDL